MPNVQVTVTNTGGHTVNSISIPGVGVYSVPQDLCSSLAPGQSCTSLDKIRSWRSRGSGSLGHRQPHFTRSYHRTIERELF